MDKAKLYTISSFIAREKDIPTAFVAVELAKSPRGAVYLYGHGTMHPMSRCCRCGRTLTHPGSILIGIGPECLGDWGVRESIAENMSEADAKRLRSFVTSKVVDCWIPSASIKSEEDSKEFVSVPADHKMVKPKANEPVAKTAKIDQTGQFVQIRFAYDAKIVEAVRTLEGRMWNGKEKYWSAWANTANLTKLAELGFSLDQNCSEILNPKPARAVKVTSKEVQIQGLYPFQLEGVKFLESKNGNALIGDEMGLGKTIQALGWLNLHPEKRPVVIVVPASLKINWMREANKWLTNKDGVVILSGKKPPKGKIKGNIFIINYDILGVWLTKLIDAAPSVMIVDESHMVKNIKAQRTKAVKELGKVVRHKIFLTGTPIVNRPSEFFTVLNMLAPTEFNSWIRFTQRYCGAYNDGYGWNVSGATNTTELHERINNKIMLRRKKEDVLKDLPPKQRFVLPMEISNRNTYKEAENDLLKWVKETFGAGKARKTAQAEALARFSYLKQLAAEGKREFAVSWIKDCVESNGKLVVFAVHHTMIDYLAEELRNYNPVVVDGRTSLATGPNKPVSDRQMAVDRFQNDPNCRIFIGNIKAAGVGLTLTAASHSAFVELGWTPGEHQQAEDRVHRIGQENHVSAYYLIADTTIEEEIAGLLDGKMKILDSVLDGKATDEESLLTELLRKRMED